MLYNEAFGLCCYSLMVAFRNEEYVECLMMNRP